MQALMVLCLFLTAFIFHASATPNTLFAEEKKSAPNVSYGQIFIEENKEILPSNVEAAVFLGQAVGSASITSWFYLAELKAKIASYFYIGLEFAWYRSKLHKGIKTMLPSLTMEGVKISAPAMRNLAGHLNLHFNFFTSYVNLAGLAKMSMSIPIQVGAGFTRIKNISVKNIGEEIVDEKSQKISPSLQWGIGPRMQFGSHVALQMLFSQMYIVSDPVFQFHHLQFGIVYGF